MLYYSVMHVSVAIVSSMGKAGRLKKPCAKGREGKHGHLAQPRAAQCLTVAITAAGLGVAVDEYKRLLMMGFPTPAYELLRFTAGPAGAPLDMVEFFCGVAAHVRAFQRAGCTAVGCDVLRDHEYMDILSPAGMVCGITLARSLHPLGVAWLAVVCSSWVFISNSSTGRHIDAR